MMRKILAISALLAGLLPAAAQVPNFPQTLPANTVVGRLGTGAGPSQAIPFATLSAQLFSATNVSTVFNTAFCSTSGMFLKVTSPAHWGCSAISAIDLPNPATNALGGVQSLPIVNGQVLGGISNTGVIQPATSAWFTSNLSQALAVGRLGNTTPAFQVDASQTNQITGITIAGQASGNGVNLSAIGETNVPLIINAAGSGTINFGTISTGSINNFQDTFINKTTPKLAFTSGNTNETGILQSKGTGGFLFKNDSSETIGSIVPAAGSGIISWVDLRGQTGTTSVLQSAGTGSDHGLTVRTKGSGTLILGTDSVNQITIPHVAGVTNLMQLNGSNGGNPTATTTGGNLALTCASGCGTTTISPVTGAAVTGGFNPTLRAVQLTLDLNSVGAEKNFTSAIVLPSPATRFRIATIGVINTGTTASLTTAQLGVYSATGGGGTAYATALALTACTANSSPNAGQFCAPSLGTLATRIFSSGASIFVRTDTAQGAAATGDILLTYEVIQ